MIQCKINFQKIFYFLCIPLYLSSTFLVDASPRHDFDDDFQYDSDGYLIPNSSQELGCATIEPTYATIEPTYANIAEIIYANINLTDATIAPKTTEEIIYATIEPTYANIAEIITEETLTLLQKEMLLTMRTPSKQSGCSAHMKRNKKRYSVAASVAALLLTCGIAAAWLGGAFSGNKIQSVPDLKQSVPDLKFAVDTGIIFTGNTLVKPTVKQCDSSLPKAIANGMTVDMRDPQYCDSSTAWTCWTEYLSGCKVVGEYLTDCLWKLIPSHAHQYATYDITCHRTSKKFRVLIERDNRAARLTRYSEVLDVYPNE